MPTLATKPALRAGTRIEPRHRRPPALPLSELTRTRRALPLLTLLMFLVPIIALAAPRG